MPDEPTTDNRAELAVQLALAIAAIYSPGTSRVVTAGAALVAAMQNYRAANIRPPDWVPTEQEWNAIITEADNEIAKRKARIAELESQQEPPPPTP